MTDNNGHDAHETDDQWRRHEDDHTRRIAKDAAHQAVNETLQRLGIDETDWKETQKDNAFTRRMRTGTEKASTWIARTTIGTVVIGICYAVWQAMTFNK